VAAAVKAALRVSGLPDVELDLSFQGVTVDAGGVRVEVGTSSSHQDYLIVVVTDTTGEDQIWRIPTRARLADILLGSPT
jgi:hypothetical protein